MDNIEIINEWTGQAAARRQIVTITVTNVTVGANYSIRVASGRVAEYRATAGDTLSTIATGLAAQLTGGNWTVSTSGNVITLTGSQIGESFADAFRIEKIPASWVERIQEGAAPTPHELTITIPEGTTGGTWDLTCDFGNGPEPLSGLAPDITAAALQTALEGLATPVPGDVVVTLVSSVPRTYRVKFQGDLSGLTVASAVDADGLTGHAKAVVKRVQFTGSDSPEIWTITLHPILESTITINGVSLASFPAEWERESYWSERLGKPLLSFSMQFIQISSLEVAKAVIFAIDSQNTITASHPYTYSVEAKKIQSRHTPANNCWQLVPYHVPARTISFGGQTSALGNRTPGEVSASLNALASVGAGNFQIGYFPGQHPNWTGPVIVKFQGSRGTSTQPLMTFSEGPAATMIATGGPTLPEVHTLHLIASGGTFDLTGGTGSETEIPYNVTPENLAPILEDITGMEFQEELTDGFTLSGTGHVGNPFTVTYSPGVSVSLLTADGSNLTGGATITPLTVVTGVAGRNEQQLVHIDPTSTGGTFRFALNNVTTAAILYNADSDVWMSRFAAAFGAGSAIINGTPAAMLVEFSGSLKQQPLALLQIDQDELIVTGSQLTMSRIQEGSGPNYWNDPDNWTLGHPPQSGEIAILGSGRSQITRGLRQAAECQFDDEHVLLLNGGADFVVGQKVRFRTTGTLPTTSTGSDDESVIDATGIAGLINPAGMTEEHWINQALSLVCPMATLSGEDPGYAFRTYETPWVTVGMVPGSALEPATQFKLRIVVWTSTPSATVELVRSTNTVMGTATFSLNANFAGGANATGSKSSQTPSTPSTLFPSSAPFVWIHSGAPLSATKDYYIVAVNRDPEQPSVQVSCCLHSAPIVFTSSGTGTHRIGVQLKGLQSYARFTGQLGLTRRTTGGEWILHHRYLSIDFENPENGKPNLEIGIGLGDGSGRFMVDAGPAYVDARVILSQAGSTEPAVQILNRNLDQSEMMVIAGDVGLGIEPTERVAMKRIVAFGGTLLANNLDYKQLEDYAQAVRFVTGQASANVVQLRTR